MKQFLRHIFFLVAMFMPIANLSAQLAFNKVYDKNDWNNSNTTIEKKGGSGNDNQWDEDGGMKFKYYKWSDATGGFDRNEKYVDIRLSESTCKKRLRCAFVIQDEATKGKDYYFAIFPSADGTTFPEEWKWKSSGDKNDMEQGQTCEIDLAPSVKFIRISYFGNLSGYCKDLIVSELTGCDDYDLFTALGGNSGKLKLNYETNTQILELNCIPASLSFSYYGYDDNLLYGRPEFSLCSSTTNNNSESYTKSHGNYNSETKRWAHNISLTRDVKYLKYYSNITKKDIENFITDVRITPARFIEVCNNSVVPQNSTETTIDFGDVFIGYSYEPKSFYLTYSDVQNISLKKNNSQIRLSEEQIPIECGQFTPLGTSREIKITLNPTTEGQINETITITDEAKTKTAKVVVKANVKRVTFEGHTDDKWKENNNWNCGKFPNDIRIPITIKADVTLREGTFAVKEVKFENDAKLHITHKSGLTIGEGGVIGAKDGTVTIDNLPEGAGFLRIAPSATNKLTKQVTVNYATMAYNSGNPQDEVWQYVGAPGSGMQMNNVDKTLIYHWNEQKGWVKNSGTSLEPFVGYALTQDQAQRGEFEIIAMPIFENKKIDFTKTQEGMNGDNLFVNSYLSPIDVARIEPNTDYSGIEGTFYLFNSGSWKNWQDGDPNSVTVDDSPGQYFAITPGSAALIDANEDQTTIPPMQGAYVIAQTNDAWIKLDYKKHVYDVTSSMNRPMRAPQENDEDFMRVRLQVNSDNSGSDRMYVIQYGECTSGYDNGYDARNILVEGQANLYTHEIDGQMEISVSDNINETYIGFSAGSDSEYTLRFTSVVGELYLKDLETETVWAVMDGEEYTFYATPNTKNDRRFLLLDHKPEQSGGVSTGVENVHSTKAWIADNVVYVTNAPINTELVVYTMSGVVVTSLVTTTPYTTIDVANMPTGVYMLRLNDKVYKFVCK